MPSRKWFTLLTVLELAAAIAFVAFDLFLPALMIALLGVLMLTLRHEPLATLGYHMQAGFGRLVGVTFLWALLWTAVDFCLLLPLLARLTGEVRNLSGYQALKGNVGMLLFMLAGGWVLGGLLEEFAFRGVLMARVQSLLGSGTWALVGSALFANVLFGFLHMEQGLVGVLITIIDAGFFAFMKIQYRNTWAATLAHGFLNSIGIVILFFTGPLPVLW